MRNCPEILHNYDSAWSCRKTWRHNQTTGKLDDVRIVFSCLLCSCVSTIVDLLSLFAAYNVRNTYIHTHTHPPYKNADTHPSIYTWPHTNTLTNSCPVIQCTYLPLHTPHWFQNADTHPSIYTWPHAHTLTNSCLVIIRGCSYEWPTPDSRTHV
jgi:hypothetical protein